jgi:membrane-associated HD superfamily phosphohydrolase
MKVGLPLGIVPVLASIFGAISEMRIAIYAMAAVFIVLIFAFFILALRGVTPIFESGKKTKFRLARIDKKKSPPT